MGASRHYLVDPGAGRPGCSNELCGVRPSRNGVSRPRWAGPPVSFHPLATSERTFRFPHCQSRHPSIIFPSPGSLRRHGLVDEKSSRPTERWRFLQGDDADRHAGHWQWDRQDLSSSTRGGKPQWRKPEHRKKEPLARDRRLPALAVLRASLGASLSIATVAPDSAISISALAAART